MFLKKVDCEKKRKRWFLRFLSGQGSPSIAITNRVQTISFVSWDPKRETCTHGRRLIELGCTRRGTKWRSSCKCLYNLQAINRIARCNNLYSHGRENTCDTATPLRGDQYRNLYVLLARGHCCSWLAINTGLFFREEVASKRDVLEGRKWS